MLGYVKRFAHGRLPGYLVNMLRRSLAAEQVYAQGVSGRRSPRIDRCHRDSHGGVPDLLLPIDPGGRFESRVPRPARLVMRIVQIHIQVDPFALRRNFEFLVMLYIREVGTDKYFRYVPVPKLVGFLVSIRFRFNVQFFVRTSKQKVQVILRPARANFRAISRDRLSKRVFFHEDRTGGAPKGQSWIDLQRHVLFREGALEYGLPRGERGDATKQQNNQGFSEAIHPNAPVRRDHPANADTTRTRGRFLLFVPARAPHADQDTSVLRADPGAAEPRECREGIRETGVRDRRSPRSRR